MLIRPCRPEEIAAVLDLWRLAGAEPSATDDERSLLALIERDPDSLMIALSDGEIVGTLIAAWDGWRGQMYRLAVAAAHRRRGIGRTLVADAERRLAKLGTRRVNALVLGETDGAIAFWESVGYVHHRGIRRHVRTLP
ncbi:MAG TPA: GNAT family N-acetyltransferase [Egibacteraceae bacterium]|nr:GNAT family N-acetyltransferase [Egibacteraceae bacterium]